jgi:gluconate/galactonate dehydratase
MIMELKITDFRACTVQANFEWTFVRIYSNDLFGTGEAGPAPGLQAMASEFKNVLVGEDAFKINRIEQKLRYATLYSGTTTYHVISAISMAIYDLLGKYLNLPVYKILGGDREEVRVYIDAHAGKGLEAMSAMQLPVKPPGLDPDAVETERLETSNNPIHGRLSQERWTETYTAENYSARAKRLEKEGFNAFKFDLDVPTPYMKEYNTRSGDLTLKDIDYMASIVKAVRENLGDELELMVDLHWRYNLNTAIRMCRALEPYRLRWIEDPTPAQITVSNFEELRMLTSQTSAPIETGENMYSVNQFRDLLPTGVRVWAPDFAKAGGINEGRRIAELASAFDIELSPHNIGSPIATMASAHVGSVSNTWGALEFHGHDSPFWNDIAKRRVIEKGFIHLTDEPGLGVELDEAAMRKYWPEFSL